LKIQGIFAADWCNENYNYLCALIIKKVFIMTLSQKERNTIVNLRIERAKEALVGAEDNALILKNWTIAGNRIYYAAYYIVSALLIQHNHIAQTHVGSKSLFHQYFVKTGIVDVETGKMYSRLFEIRQSCDYDDFCMIDEKDILPLLEQAKLFVSKIERLINEGNNNDDDR
jgi:uncharacterized protein (UPF0332 family)